MATQFRFSSTTSMPERVHVTEELERRFKEQEEAKQARSSRHGVFKTASVEDAAEAQR